MTSDFPVYFSTLLDAISTNEFSNNSSVWTKLKKNIGISSYCLFSPIMDLDERQDDRAKSEVQALVSINLVPCEDGTHIVNSWLKRHDSFSKWVYNAHSSANEIEQFINMMAFCESEDTSINPTLWDNLNKEQQQQVVDLMAHDIFRGPIGGIPTILKISQI